MKKVIILTENNLKHIIRQIFEERWASEITDLDNSDPYEQHVPTTADDGYSMDGYDDYLRNYGEGDGIEQPIGKGKDEENKYSWAYFDKYVKGADFNRENSIDRRDLEAYKRTRDKAQYWDKDDERVGNLQRDKYVHKNYSPNDLGDEWDDYRYHRRIKGLPENNKHETIGKLKRHIKSLIKEALNDTDKDTINLYAVIRYVDPGADDYDKIEKLYEDDTQRLIKYLAQWDCDECELEEKKPKLSRYEFEEASNDNYYTLLYDPTIGGRFLLYRKADQNEIDWYMEKH